MKHVRSRSSAKLSSTVVTAPDLASALALAIREPGAIAQVFLTDWVEVDLARAHVASLGLAGRIVVHHLAALVALRRLCILPGAGVPPAEAAPAPTSLKRFIDALSAACGARNRSCQVQHGEGSTWHTSGACAEGAHSRRDS